MVDQKLSVRIQEELQKKSSDEEILRRLTKEGWPPEDIHGALALSRLQKGAFTPAQYVVHPNHIKVPAGNSLLQILLILILLASAPGAYGLVAGLIVPAAKGEPVVASDSLKGYDLLRDVPPLIPVAAIDTVKAVKSAVSPQPVSVAVQPRVARPTPSSGVTPVPAPSPAPAVPAQTKESAPAITFTSKSSSITAGSQVTIQWSAPAATSCIGTDFDTKYATSGSARITLENTKTFSLSCTNGGGTTVRNLTVTAISSTGTPIPDPTPTPVPPPTPEPVPTPVPTPIPSPEPAPTPTPVPPPTPAPAPTLPPVSSALSGTYKVYPGCEAPGRSFTRTVYIDPVAGADTGNGSSALPFKTLAATVSAKKLLPGDHVLLLPGNHGSTITTAGRNPELANAANWVWIDFQSGAYADRLDIRGMSRWIITDALVKNTALKGAFLISFTGGSNMVLADSTLYTEKSSAGWGVDKWLTAASGLLTTDTTCVSAVRNVVTNVRNGMFASSNTNSSTASANSVRVLFDSNKIQNFSGDGMRPIGSDITFTNNYVADEYVSAEDGDANHDDAIQSYALNDTQYSGIRIDHNWVQETTDPNRALNASMQGISSFGGVISAQITNNVVISSHFHGITWEGLVDSLIDHNTVINPSSNGRKTWIRIVDDNGRMPVNVTVTNNVATLITASGPGITSSNNYEVPDPYSVYELIDLQNNRFDLRPKPGSLLEGKGVGASITSSIALAPSAKGQETQLAAADAAVSEETKRGVWAWFIRILRAVWDFLTPL